MVDIEKQVAYWRTGALEDWDAALHLIKGGHVRFGLFAVHLAIEKALKALVCRHTNELAPKDHNLLRLAGKAGLALAVEQAHVLTEANAFNIEGRYADSLGPLPTPANVGAVVKQAEGVFRWLIAL